MSNSAAIVPVSAMPPRYFPSAVTARHLVAANPLVAVVNARRHAEWQRLRLMARPDLHKLTCMLVNERRGRG